MTLAKEIQVDRWPLTTVLSRVTSAGFSRASFPGGMAAVELENMACIPVCPFSLGGSMIK